MGRFKKEQKPKRTFLLTPFCISHISVRRVAPQDHIASLAKLVASAGMGNSSPIKARTDIIKPLS